MTDWRLTFGSIICYARGHKRGKRIMLALDAQPYGGDGKSNGLRCPRCGATWTRKARKAKP